MNDKLTTDGRINSRDFWPAIGANLRVSLEKMARPPYPDADMTNREARFGGIRRLFGAQGEDRLRSAHVCVIGIGGVGSWAVEALARSGVGELTLIDADEVCVSNVNRQSHALEGEFGRPKVDVVGERVRAVNPQIKVHALAE